MRKVIATVVLATAVVLGVPAAAHAAGHCQSISQQSSGNYGILNGTQFSLPVTFAADLTDNALGLLGYASASRSAGDTTTCS